MSNTQIEETIEAEVEEQVEAHVPREYKVLFFNDDKTTFQFVIEVLHLVFHKDFEQAVQITQQVHDNGYGIAGYYPREIAEEKTAETMRLAKQNGFPLKVTYEEV